ncbi:MAG TPA: Ig-like domain repeat protein [Bacteroidota bacterium]|nr:Ig-like domain repeat protein [Bacteroidota bacterium]
MTFNGTGTQAINGTAASQTFYNVALTKTAGTTLSVGGSTTTVTVNNLTETTSNFTAPATLNINGALTLSAGTFTAGANTNIAGNWTNNGGTFTPGTGTVTFNGTGAQAINGTAASQTFYNVALTKTAGTTLSVGGSTTTLTVNNLTETTGNFTAPATLNINGALTLSAGTFTAGANTNIAGNWTNNGATFTAGTNSILFNGTNAQAIGGTSATTFNSVTDANTSASLAVNTNTTVNGTLTVNAGAVISPAAAVVMSGTGTLTGNGTVQVTRTVATPDFSSQYTITNKTLTNLTVEYAGSAAQTVSALTYGGLRVNNGSGVTLGGNATVNGTLAFANGILTTGANTLSVGSAGSVTGAGAGKYVFGNLQRTFPTGVQSFTYDIGDASNYTPVALAFANVSVSGTVTAKTTTGDHPQIASSEINSSQSVNRYWTLTSGGGMAFTTYNSTFTFVPGDVDAGANTSTFIAGNYSASAWSYPTVGTKNPTSTQVTGLSSFGDFALGDIKTFTITASAGLNGSISPSGSVQVNYNASQGFTFTPSTGYHVDSIYVDGNYAGNGSSYTFNNVVANHTISVTFAINQFTITASTGSNGSISPSGSVQVTYNGSQGFTFTPSTGYHVDSIYVDGSYAGNGSSYTFNNVVANHTISVTFAINQFTITASAGSNGSISPSGSVQVNYNGSQGFSFTPSTGYHVDSIYVDGVYAGNASSYTFNNVVTNHTISVTFAINQFTITASAGANGLISPSGSVQVSYNGSQGFSFTASTGYHVDSIYVDGGYAGNASSYTFNNVVANHTISVTFAINQFTIMASAGANGLISPSGSVQVSYDGSQGFSFTPSTGYHVDSIYVDGAYAGNASSYTFNNVVANHTISVTFAINQFTITASAGANGAISPSGAVQVNYGVNQRFTLTPDANYQVDTLLVDGVKVDSTTGYTFSNVTAIHTISVTFKLIVYATSTGLNANSNPSVHGESVTFTATVTGGGPTPGGTVIFKDGAAAIDTSTLNGSGVATFSTSGLAVAVHSMTASYEGDASHASSVSSPLSDTVNKANTTVTLLSDINPSVFGESVIFTATVSAAAPGSGVPTGTVTFKNGTGVIGTGSLDGSGKATLTTSALSSGVHAITADYNDDVNFNSGSSSAYSDTVNKSGTTSSLTAIPSPSIFGHPVTFTATVSAIAPGSGIPTGSVIFKDGASVLDTAALNGSGQAAFTTSSLAAGVHSVSATYADDANFSPSVSSVLSDTVLNSGTSVALTSSKNPSLRGEAVTFTATVTDSGTVPTGTIIFKDGAAGLDTAALNGAGVATFTTSALTVGVHSLVADYSGDVNHNVSSSAPLSDTVNKANTSVVVTSNINPSVSGETVSFTATVSAVAPGAGIPTGTVTFKNGTGVIGSGSLDGTGKATTSVSWLAGGVHAITAEYNDDVNFNSSVSSAYSDTVNKASTSISVLSGTNPSVFGQNVTLTATVTASAPGSGVPTGTVTFKNGTGVIGSGPLDSTGKASMNISSLSTGVHSIIAEYNDDANFNPSSSAAYFDTVNKSNTTTALIANPNPSVFGHQVTFTATVAAASPGSGIPTGQVVFMDGASPIDTTVLDGSGHAAFNTSALAAGVHPITAAYLDDVNFTSSASGVLSDTVSVSGSTVALSSSANPSVHGQAVTFTAMVSNSGMVPTGKLVFMDGAVALDTATLNGLGVATFNTGSLSTGIHAMTAVYGGDANHLGASSSVLDDTVNKAGTSTAVISMQNPSVFGEPVTFQATVSAVAPGTGIPTGTVTFKNGTGVIGTGPLDSTGKATLTLSTLSTSVHAIVAEYNDDVNFTPSASGAYSDTVNKSATVVSFVSFTTSSVYGQTVGFTAKVSPVAPGAGIPTGTLTFKDGATVIGLVPLDTMGKAALNISSLSAGLHSIIAEYNDDANFSPSSSLAISDTVLKSNTQTTVVSGTNPSPFGFSVTFTASVSAVAPGSGIPTGNVVFKDGVTPIDTAVLNGSGQAMFATSSLAVAVHSITATYADDANFNPSGSTAVSDTVSQLTILSVAGANGTITPSGAVSVTYGQNKSFTIQPDTGYFVADVRVDSASVGAVNAYTFNNITASHLIQAFFAIKTYTITATAGSHGTITPSGAVVANYNTSPTFQIQPDTGYYTVDVIVDSASVGAVASYQFHNVVANHTISATFAPVNHPPTAALLIAPANNDSVFGTNNPVTFIWHTSVDSDPGDSVRYTLHLWGTGFDTVGTALKDTNQVLNLVTRLHLDSVYHWTVNSTDGKSVTASPDTFAFRVVLLTGVADRGGRIPKEFALYQNYPNPFNPTTQLQFDIPQRSSVTLTVYNILGEVVATLVDHETMEPGVKVVRLDGGNLASGLYLYRIAAEGAQGKNFVNVKKMMLIK